MNIFNKYDVNYVETSAFKKYKYCEDKILQQYLEVNLTSTDYNSFKNKELNIYRALREVALNKLHKKYDFIHQMDKFNWNTDTEYAECTEPMF